VSYDLGSLQMLNCQSCSKKAFAGRTYFLAEHIRARAGKAVCHTTLFLLPAVIVPKHGLRLRVTARLDPRTAELLDRAGGGIG